MDVAALALKIDSKSVAAATDDLDRFAKASDRARTAAGGTASMAQGYARSAEKINQYANAATRAASAAQTAAKANSSATAATTASSPAIARNTTLLDRMAAAYDLSRDAVAHWARQLRAGRSAATEASTDIGRVTRAANDNIGALRANSGNIAAQFQDIGVTAAMEMSPLNIGLQQGTQLAAVFAQSGQSMGAALSGAFKQIASAQALTIIGLVALVAAMLQMVDWANLAQSALNGLADILVTIAPYAVALAGGLALIYAPAILSGIGSVTKAFYGLATSILASVGLPALVVAGLVAIVAAAVHWRDDLTKMLGVDIVGAAKEGLNWIVGSFVGSFNAIKATWRQLPAAIGDVVITAANRTIATVENMVNASVSLINGMTAKLPFGLGSGLKMGGVSFGQLDNPFAGAAQGVADVAKASIAAARKVDYVGKAIAGVNSLAQSGADKLREWAKALGGEDAKKTGGGGAADAASSALKKQQKDPWAELLDNADKQQRALEQAGARIGVYGQSLATLTHQQELFNQAQDKGIPLTAKMTNELNDRAAKLGAAEYGNIVKAASEASDTAYADSMRQLEQQRGALGLTGAALQSYNYQQQAINAELQKGVAYKDIDIAKIQEQADAYGAARASIDQTAQAIADARGLTSGFFSDWINGVRQGEGVFKSFEKAITNALDHIIEKIIEAAIEQMVLNALFGAGGGGGGGGGPAGIFGNLLGGLLGGIFGGGKNPIPNNDYSALSAVLKMANGGAFGTAERFAKGGTFTNQIITQATPFRFANGTALGEMGEAGPEAIMPLKRGANGSLGVQVHGGAGKRPIKVSVHNHNSFAGAIGVESIAAMDRQTAEATYNQLKRDLQSLLQQWQNDGTVA